MKLLAIDTSTDNAGFALAINNELIIRNLKNVKQHAEYLLPTVRELLEEAGITVADCDGIVFGRGPGSFTGLRVACSVTQALAYAYDLPVYPVSTLQAIAYKAFSLNSSNKNINILSLIDARMQQVYWAYYDRHFITAKENVSSPEDIIDSKKPVIIAGSNIESHYKSFPAHLKNCEKIILYPEPSYMIKLVQEGFIKQVNAENALPVYLRDALTS